MSVALPKDPKLAKAAEYLYKNAPYEQFCEMGRSVYGFSGKALIKFIVESKHKKSGMVDITDDAAAAELAGKLMGERYFHPVFPSPDGRANWFVPAPPGDTWSKVLKSSRQKYVWEYTESRAKLYTLLGALIFVSIGICLFPVWPMWMKRGLHYILVTLLAVAIVFLIIRGLIFGAVWFFGYEFWILPNILSEDDELFKPLITFKKAKGVKAWHRAVAVALVAMVAYWIITQPSDFDRLVMAQKQFVSDLYSGALLGDATQADKDRMRAEGVDLDAEVDPTPTAEAEPVAADRFSGSVHSDYDHLDFEPDVPLDDEA